MRMRTFHKIAFRMVQLPSLSFAHLPTNRGRHCADVPLRRLPLVTLVARYISRNAARAAMAFVQTAPLMLIYIAKWPLRLGNIYFHLSCSSVLVSCLWVVRWYWLCAGRRGVSAEDGESEDIAKRWVRRKGLFVLLVSCCWKQTSYR